MIDKTNLYLPPLPNPEIAQQIETFPRGRQGAFILHNLYHGRVLPGIARSQGISSYGIDLTLQEYFGLSNKICHFRTFPDWWRTWLHYGDVIMDAMASQITSLAVVYSTVYSDVDQGKHQSSASLAFVWEIHRGPVNSPHKWPVTRKMFPFDDVIMINYFIIQCNLLHPIFIIFFYKNAKVCTLNDQLG